MTGNETVLVFARATEGPAMPIAVVRRTVADLPTAVRLDASNSMLADRSLDSVEHVEIIARVSHSGDAMARSGDFEGATSTLPTGGRSSITLAIDRRIP